MYEPEIRRTLANVLSYARGQNYAGWDYVDGMSSRLLRALPFESKWLNLAVQETAKRAPINLRPLFLIEQRRNFMGTALFAMANLTADDLVAGEADPLNRGPDVDYRTEGTALLDWLLTDRRPGYSGFCGGHNHVIQGLHHRGPIEDPDLVSTSYGVKALLRGARYDETYSEVARTAEEWAVNDMDYREVDGGAKITYFPKHPDDVYTLNAGAIGGRLFLDLYDYFGDDRLREYGEKILSYIADHQTSSGGWYYRVPADSSHLSMDNHHNGFIIESLQRHREVTGSNRFDETIDRAVEFYRDVLFEPDGAPNWDEDSAYPRDVHGAAQGIVVFTYAGDLEFARRIIHWTRENLSDDAGRFYFRKQRFYTKWITLMRWCQAFMAYAISEYLAAAESRRQPGEA
ncbi:MAG: antibiotic ABC transporter permease [Halosimplex sp.]